MAEEPLAKYLAEQAEALSQLLERVQDGLTSAQIHDLRVAMRRLRAALRLADPGCVGRGLERRLQRSARQLGRQRELEVAIEDGKVYGLDPKSLGKRQRKGRDSLRKRLEGRRGRRILKELARLKGSITHVGMKPTELAPIVTGLRSWGRRLPVTSAEFHELRIDVRRARYAVESLGRKSEPLEKLQQILGRAHDLEMLQELLGKNKRVRHDERELEEKARKDTRRVIGFALRELGGAPGRGRPRRSRP